MRRLLVVLFLLVGLASTAVAQTSDSHRADVDSLIGIWGAEIDNSTGTGADWLIINIKNNGVFNRVLRYQDNDGFHKTSGGESITGHWGVGESPIGTRIFCAKRDDQSPTVCQSFIIDAEGSLVYGNGIFRKLTAEELEIAGLTDWSKE